MELGFVLGFSGSRIVTRGPTSTLIFENKVAIERVLVLHREYGILIEDPIEVHDVSDHFQSIFAPYTTSDSVLAAKEFRSLL